jgi:FlaA1/EpsC-like NDP-sugar epimerase
MAVKALLGISTEELTCLIDSEPNSVMVCFGAGHRGEIIQSFLSHLGINTDYFCDNSERLRGKAVNGIAILGLMELYEIAKRVKINLLITSNARDAIKMQLETNPVKGIMIIN